MFAMRYGKLYLTTDPEGFSTETPYVGHVIALDLGIGIQVYFKSVVVYSDSHAEFGEWKAKLVTVCTIKLGRGSDATRTIPFARSHRFGKTLHRIL